MTFCPFVAIGCHGSDTGGRNNTICGHIQQFVMNYIPLTYIITPWYRRIFRLLSFFFLFLLSNTNSYQFLHIFPRFLEFRCFISQKLHSKFFDIFPSMTSSRDNYYTKFGQSDNVRVWCCRMCEKYQALLVLMKNVKTFSLIFELVVVLNSRRGGRGASTTAIAQR